MPVYTVGGKVVKSGGKLVTAPSGTFTGPNHGYNLAPFAYYQSTYHFINVFKNSDNIAGTTGPVDADDWLTAMPTAQTVTCTIAGVMDPVNGYFPPGQYTVKSASALANGLTLTMTASAGLTVNTTGVGFCTFTTVDMGTAWDTLTVQLRVTNATGSAQVWNDCYICLATDEAALLAGSIFRPQLLLDMQGASSIRVMDVMNTNGLDLRFFTDYGSQNETRRTYTILGAAVALNYVGTPRMPWSICAKLAKALNAKLWACFPTGSGERCFNTTFATSTITTCQSPVLTAARTHNITTNQHIVFYTFGGGSAPGIAPLALDTVYFAVNVTTTTFQVSLTSGGAAVTFTNGSDTGPSNNSFSRVATTDFTPYVDMWKPISDALFAADSTISVIGEHSNEVWNTGAVFQQSRFANSILGQIASGTPNGKTGNAWAQLQVWKALNANYPAGQVYYVMGGQNGLAANASQLTYTDPGFIAGGSTVATIMIAKGTKAMLAVAPYMTPDDGLGHVPPTPTQIYTNNGNSDAVPDATWDAMFNRAIATNVTKLAANTTVMGNIPGCLLVCYEWGHQYFQNGADSHNVAIGRNFQTYLDSAAGAAIYASGYAQTIVANGMSGPICHYWGAGGYLATSTQVIAWGIKNGVVADTPRAAWFKTI